jgi:pimeloyl-ACP methyl ester carboxylesterase
LSPTKRFSKPLRLFSKQWIEHVAINLFRRKIVDWILFQPFAYPEGEWEPDGLNVEDCFIPTSDGTQLHGWWCPVENSTQTVFYAHGNRGNLATRTGILKKLQSLFRWNIFIYDYRGYGRSEGRPSVSSLLDDSAAALDFLCRKTSSSPPELVMIGRSLGGAVVSHLAAERGARALIVECTFSSLQAAATVRYPRWLANSLVGPWLNTADLIDRYQGPLILGHGEADVLIPVSHSEALFERANNPKYLFRFPERGHKDHAPDWFWEEVGRIVGQSQSQAVSLNAASFDESLGSQS